MTQLDLHATKYEIFSQSDSK